MFSAVGPDVRQTGVTEESEELLGSCYEIALSTLIDMELRTLVSRMAFYLFDNLYRKCGPKQRPGFDPSSLL